MGVYTLSYTIDIIFRRERGEMTLHHSSLSLRIDNTRRGRIRGLWNIQRTSEATTTTCDVSNKNADFSVCVVT